MRTYPFSSILAAIGCICIILLLASFSAYSLSAPKCTDENMDCIATRINTSSAALKEFPTVQIAPPANQRLITYTVETRGSITANLAEFKSQANQTLNDKRGWSQLNIYFQEVASGGNFTLVLSEASAVPSFSSGCDATYSCNVGRFVIINQDRWQSATLPWNNAGGTLRDYRHMVINHEIGHWLGHGHAHCTASGQPAAVMQQQSINLGGCTFNPWPLSNELTAPALGIT